MAKDGMPKVTPDLSFPEQKVWISNYEIMINGTKVRNSVMVPRGAKRQEYRDALGASMANDLARMLEQMFGD